MSIVLLVMSRGRVDRVLVMISVMEGQLVLPSPFFFPQTLPKVVSKNRFASIFNPEKLIIETLEYRDQICVWLFYLKKLT